MSHAYRLTGRIEAGELAELFEAVQEPGGSQVVIKLFHPKTSDPRYAAVLAEAYSVLNPLRSEGVVHVVDMGFVNNRLAVVREAVDGHSLGTVLQRLNTREVLLPPSIALSLIIQLLEALELAHVAGVVHGAITPGNVLVSRAGQPGVCDFGALQALLAVPTLKRAFVGRGRSAYRAPEVGRGNMPDVLSDIYSIGAIAYELLTLREAVIPDGGVSTRRAGLPPPSRLDRRIHARLDPILLRALEFMPSRRFRSCAEFASSLRNFLSTHGGLPGGEELHRFVAELFPNEVSVGSSGPLPFSERFTLTPVSGVSLAQVSAEALEKSVVVRPSFSPALSEADTMKAPPAFEEYQPEPTVVPPPPMSALEDEQTWVAPPGAVPPRPRRGPVMGGAASAARDGTRVGKHPRLRVVEDLSRPEKPEQEGDPEDRIDTAKLEGTVVRARVPEGTVTRVRVPPSLVRGHESEQPSAAEPDRSYIPMPPPTSPGLEAATVAGHRLFTEERNLLADAKQRRRMLAVAGGIALVGVVCFAFGVWKVTRRPQFDPDPKVSAVSGAVQQYLQQPSSSPPASPKQRPTAPPEPVVVSDSGETEDSRRTGSAYLTIDANLPARAYIDGVRVKRNLPLTRYPVMPGTREIILETIGTPRQREVFQMRLERGEHKKLEQLFKDSPHR